MKETKYPNIHRADSLRHCQPAS